jgi:hypothetical protein
MHEKAGRPAYCLHEVARFRVIVNIQFRMMRAGAIVERILNELEPRQPHRIEGKMIRAAGVANRNGAGAQILERREPGIEDGPHHVITLKMNAPDLSGAVVQVQVAAKPGMFGLRAMVMGSPKCSRT